MFVFVVYQFFQQSFDFPGRNLFSGIVLQMIQEFEPAGVGASNLRECLLLQLERHEGTPANLLAYKIIDKMFEEFSKKHYDKIMRQCNVCEEELKQAIREITLLNPSPEAHGTTAIRAARNITLFPTFLSKRKMGS